MVRILAIHNTNFENREVLAKMKKRYKTIAQYPDMFCITVVRFGVSVKNIPVKKRYDQLYYHKDTVDVGDLANYIVHSGATEIIDFSIEEPKEKIEVKEVKKHGKEKVHKQTKEVKIRRIQGRRKTG